MKRFALSVLILIGTASTVFAGQELPTLRSSVMLSSDVLKVGDLFDNAGPKAEQPVARAPAPGRRVTLDAAWLSQVATAYGVNWRPATAYDRTVVERASNTVSRRQIETELVAALAKDGVAPDSEIELAGRDVELRIPAEAMPTVAVRDLQFDRNTNRLIATVESPAGAPDAQRLRVSGRVFQTAEVPVLARNVGKAEIITPSDLEFRRMRLEQVRQDTVTDADQLIGKSPRSYLRAGTMVRSADVRAPVAVAKNALVTMVLKNGAMLLTAQGRAIEEGGVGDTIRVINTSSNITVQARVDAQNRVSVLPTSRVLANYQPVAMPMPAPQEPPASANSLWRSGARQFFKDQRAKQIGDILTVAVNIESEKADMKNQSTQSRNNSESTDAFTLFGVENSLGRVLPETANPANLVDFGSDRATDGAGTIKREETVKVNLAAVITQVLPNGNLVIQGKQEVRVNYEMRELTVTGVIRPEDITAKNTISYEKIAEARISYGGRGTISDMQQPRYGQQIFDILFPF